MLGSSGLGAALVVGLALVAAPRGGLEAAGPEPRLVGEGSFSTALDEFGTAFTPDGQLAVFTVSVPRSNLYVLCQSRFRGGRWSEPEVLPFSGQYWDFDPVLSPDGKTMVFASDRPVPGRTRPDQDFDIWKVTRTAKGWSTPVHLDAVINSDADETFASIAASGTLYFVSGREGGRAGLAIYRSRLLHGRYQPAEKLAGGVNGPDSWSLEVVVAPDEHALLLVPYGRKDGFGGFDVYVSEQDGGVWSEPRNLGAAVNTAARDYSPRFAPDGKSLYWSSERGMATETRQTPLDAAEWRAKTSGVLDGWGNTYQIDLGAVGLGGKR